MHFISEFIAENYLHDVTKSQYFPRYFTYIYYSEKKCICSEDLLPKKASILLGIQFDDTKYQELKTHLEKIRIARNLVSSKYLGKDKRRQLQLFRF